MKKFPNETSTLQHRTHLRHFQRKTIPHEMSPDPDKQAKTHTHTHMRRESRNTIRFLRSLFEFPVSVERVFVRKKKEKERKKGEKNKERERKKERRREAWTSNDTTARYLHIRCQLSSRWRAISGKVIHTGAPFVQ